MCATCVQASPRFEYEDPKSPFRPIMPTVARISVERPRTHRATRKTQQIPSTTAQCMDEVLPKLLDVIFNKHPAFVEDREKSKLLLGLHDRLVRSSYALRARDDKDVITYKPRNGDELGNVRRGAISFCAELGLQLLSDQTIGSICLQSGIADPNDPTELRICNEIVIHVQERNPLGPIAVVRRIAGELKSHWLESAGFNSRLLSGLDCTVFDCVVVVLSPFGVVREDLPGLRWGSPVAGVKNIRRRFFANNPDLTGEINQTEYPERFQKMTYSQLNELRLEIKGRMSRANMIAWRLDGYRHVPEFRSLTLQEVGERCFPFMTLPIFDRAGIEEKAEASSACRWSAFSEGPPTLPLLWQRETNPTNTARPISSLPCSIANSPSPRSNMSVTSAPRSMPVSR